jgi:hypothetical protein
MRSAGSKDAVDTNRHGSPFPPRDTRILERRECFTFAQSDVMIGAYAQFSDRRTLDTALLKFPSHL